VILKEGASASSRRIIAWRMIRTRRAALFTTSAVTEDTRRLAASMHVVNGAQDIPFYRGDASHNAFAAAYSAATFEMIDDAGHYSILETPVRVASIIEKRVAAAG
jgi:3-oxoadipate enol-lactonase